MTAAPGFYYFAVLNCCTVLIVSNGCRTVFTQAAVRPFCEGLAIGLASVCVKTVLQPSDTIKKVQQFSTANQVNSHSAPAVPPPPSYRSPA